MADIKQYLDKIRSAIFGEEVRGSIVDAITAMNSESSQAKNEATTAEEQARASANAAKASEQRALEASAHSAKIDKMTVAANKLAEGSSPTVSISDDGAKKHLIFGIPKGDRGITGLTPNITMTATTGEEGTDVAIVKTGTAENPKFALTIPRGDTGPQGPIGVTPNISARVETGAPGTSASVTKAGTAENPVLTFTIPRGSTGLTPDISIRAVTTDPETEAVVAKTGTAENPEFVFGIPRGTVGEKGDPGPTPQIAVHVNTGEPNSLATVVQSGTAENPVLTFTIPKGDTGSLGNLTVNGEAPDASGRIIVKRLYNSTGESYVRLRYQDAVLPYIEVTGGGEYAGADFALRKEIGKKGIVCRYRESVNDEYHYDRVYTTENPPPYPVTKVNNRTGEVILDHLRRTATGFRVSLGGNEENWTLNALTQDNKNKSIVFVNSNTGAITLYYNYADDNTTHETARVYTEKAPPPSDIVPVGSQATLAVNGTITLTKSIKNAHFIQTRVNYIGTTGSLSGANPQVIDFAVISSTSDTVDMNHAFFTLSSDGLTLTFKSGERVRINKNTLYMSCEALANVNIGPVYAVF